MSLKLYSYNESGNSYKVRLLAALLKVDLEIVELDYFSDEQHSEKFLKINPKGEVPALVDGDIVLTDSAAILVYLAGKYSDKNTWWSEDLVEQAKIVDWLAFAASWVQFGVFTARAILSFKGPYNGLGLESTEQTLKEAKIRGHKSLAILDGVLKDREWLANNRPTIADIAVFVYVALAPMGDISLEPYPNVRAWIERIKNLPNFIKIDGLDDPLYRRVS
ncbi:glutathione S-transferase family protein [Acinetobacter sp. DSM 11652]|uniref:glutathione S-transferase family protein n=1 Tax=Acinetobacter sp. DSM 11652 TaxID=346222 RepID=UPI0008B0E997|nr:glutathione S-transferase family protein [Acinetobacter sp. DSM 11652]SEL28722.1 glutathione S-transferase [Acinetobacter sp. DSM 11652]